ncbi:MAG: 50S ribosomal protein L35ae [archaeon]
MKGTVLGFRRGRAHQTPRHFVIEVEKIDSIKKAQELIGKSVIWTTPTTKQLIGKITSTHGNKGHVRAVFEHGLPGQAVNDPVEIK